MKVRTFAVRCGLCILAIFAFSLLCKGAGTDPKVRVYGDQIKDALVSRQIDAFMEMIPRDSVIFDGSSYGVIREKIERFMDALIQADVANVTPLKPALHRITLALKLKPERSYVLHFDVAGKAGRYRIADIYSQSELMLKEGPKILKSYPSYENRPLPSFPGFKYMSPSDADLTKLRTLYELDKVAGNGSELEQIIKLMQWVHKTVPHDGSSRNPVPSNSLNIIQTSQNEKRGVNCRMLAILLNEVYLSMGFKSRMVTCLPSAEETFDCHVTNAVFSKTLNKWLYIDPSFEAYFMDKKGQILNHAEIRKAFISGIPLTVNEGINHNGRPYGGGESGYIRYMAKNFVRFVCTLNSGFGSEDISPFYVELYPKNFKSCDEFERKTNAGQFLCISNSDVFWKSPVN